MDLLREIDIYRFFNQFYRCYQKLSILPVTFFVLKYVSFNNNDNLYNQLYYRVKQKVAVASTQNVFLGSCLDR